MGNDHSQIASESGLMEAEVARLQGKFDLLRKSKVQSVTPSQPDVITEEAFVTHFSDAHEKLARKTFHAMDFRRAGTINFRDFCVVVALLAKGTADEKLDYAFSLYDQDGKGYIDEMDLLDAIDTFRHSSQRLLAELGVDGITTDRVAADALMTSMHSEVGSTDGKVTKDQFKQYCHNHPEIFKQVQTSFKAVQTAALWDWDCTTDQPGRGAKASLMPSDCVLS